MKIQEKRNRLVSELCEECDTKKTQDLALDMLNRKQIAMYYVVKQCKECRDKIIKTLNPLNNEKD